MHKTAPSLDQDISEQEMISDGTTKKEATGVPIKNEKNLQRTYDEVVIRTSIE